jgi:hypothetical protein
MYTYAYCVCKSSYFTYFMYNKLCVTHSTKTVSILWFSTINKKKLLAEQYVRAYCVLLLNFWFFFIRDKAIMCGGRE